MDSSVIILDSDDDELTVQTPKNNEQSKVAIKRSASVTNGDHQPNKKIRRIQPVKIGEIKKSDSRESADMLAKSETSTLGNLCNLNIKSTQQDNDIIMMDQIKDEMEAGPSTSSAVTKINGDSSDGNDLSTEMMNLIKECRRAEGSPEMKKIIKTKLLKYYHAVHPDYITSKIFLKSVKQITEEIALTPHQVYSKLEGIIQELDARRKSKVCVLSNEDIAVKGTGDEKKDEHLKKLYKALLTVKRNIDDLEQAEVDWDDDDDSAYIKKVRYEKRATEIYGKICELTGESEHAHRVVKKPIKFKGTNLKEFNQKLQNIVNKNGTFPNFRDVLKCLDYCCKRYKYNVTKDQMKRIAQDAFEKLGKSLQERRRNDLYESVSYYAGKQKDPAKEDPELRAKLEKNKKHYAKINDIIDQFADQEERPNSPDTEQVTSTTLKNEEPDNRATPAEEDTNNGELDELLESCDKELQEQILKTEITIDDELIMS